MISGILFVVLAWVIPLPLVASILLTVWSAICIMAFVVRLFIYLAALVN